MRTVRWFLLVFDPYSNVLCMPFYLVQYNIPPCINVYNIYIYLVGGLEHFLFSPIVGIMIQSDFHIFQGGRLNHQPDVYIYMIIHHLNPHVHRLVYS